MAELIGRTFSVGPHMVPGRLWMVRNEKSSLKYFRKKSIKIDQQLKVKIEDGREAPCRCLKYQSYFEF